MPAIFATHAPYLPEIATILAASVIVWMIPALRTQRGRLAMALVTTCYLYRFEILNTIVWNAAGFLTLTALDRYLIKRNGPRKLAWSYAQGFVLGLALVFIGIRVAVPTGLHLHIFGNDFIWLASPNMFLVLRLASLAWDHGAGRAALPPPSTYVFWMFLPVTSRGPLLRYVEFERQGFKSGAPRGLPPSDPSINLTLGSGRWWRLCGLGVLQLAGAMAVSIGGHYFGTTPARPILVKGLTTLLGPVAFYFELAGTYHLMEAFALCWGLRLPASFDNPFLRKNIAEFWKHWNMTITSFFRDYLFFNRWGLSKPNLYLNTMVLFIALGLWHAFNLYWGVWGALQGLGFCAYLAWRNLRGAAPQDESTGGAGRFIGAAFTYLFLCATLYLPIKIALSLQAHLR